MSTTKAMHGHPMRRVYIFSIPVRIFHWLNALTIVVLAATGYLISNPPALLTSAEASESFLFGWIRYIHFVAAFLFFFNFLFRIYMSAYGGNRFEKWYNFIPVTKQAWREIWDVIKVDVLMIKEKPMVSLGHNALAGFSYFVLFLAMIFQIITGFGMYAQMSDFWLPQLFDWIVPLMGGDAQVRTWHHIFMWVFIIFTIIHVYLVFYHDYVEGRGEVSSMGGGWKFIEQDCIDEESCTDLQRGKRPWKE